MESETKNMLIGAFGTGAVKAGLEGYYVATPTGGLRNTILYALIHPAIPPVDVWVAGAGTPLVLWALGKAFKKKALIELAKGGAVFGVSEILGETLYRVAMIANNTPVLSYALVR